MNEANMQAPTQQLPVSSKSPKTSLSELRNTDLVSRLLAATPPYLYNIPLTPNSYFFSEMLRSLVQAKAENSSRHNCSTSGVHGHQKRSRKRSWTQSARMNELQQHVEEGMNKERPLELTMGKSNCGNLGNLNNLGNISQSSQDQPNFFTSSQPCEQNLMLPPVLPPVWYPPMYHPSNPSPYGIDPLHFFIDLRVSGHIYDRKTNNHQEIMQGYQHGQPHEEERKHDHERNETQIDLNGQKEENSSSSLNYFKVTKHSSAFSVPNQKNPMNLSKFEVAESKTTNTRFDVKSLGFEKNENKIGAHYIMKNVNKIYGEIKAKDDVDKVENKVEIDDDNEEEEREKEKKRVKDLRALIGLELVVDYMEHSKPNGAANKNSSEDSCSTDIDDSVDSPSVDVEMCHDDDISSENNA